jgi:hypothetical protein
MYYSLIVEFYMFYKVFVIMPLLTIFQLFHGQSVLFVEEIGVPGENHRPVTTR